ncbi:helix-turn-helix domain-containing protein [Lactobacillus gasseri]|uniref:helix-turn-helix domain-containing protein n=1 Tax=Lactobacillus gasseri TaxID=1596 RepID=UPI001BFFCEB6|nr:helix-turn-helix domain-containing protein [Lactobacillus gasseri]
MNNEQPNYYSILTANVRYDRDLKANEKLLFSEITALANKSGYCTATNNYFANLYGKSKTTISNWINHLKEKGYLKVYLEKDGSQIIGRKLYPVDEPVKENKDTCTKKVQEGIKENFKPPIKEKFKENNTSINNTSINNNIPASGDAQTQIPKKLTENEIIEIEFEKLWTMYPRKLGKKDALRHYKSWRKSNKENTYELMLNKLNTYLKYLRIKHIPLEYTLHGSTWFNGRYDDELDMTPAKPRFNQQAKPVRRATNWDKVQQQQSQTVPQMTKEERNAIFRKYGR